jgi:transposase
LDHRLPELPDQEPLHASQAPDHALGAMRIFSKPCSGGSTRTRRPCAQRRETVEHPFATIKARMGAMHFLMKTLPRVLGEMALHVFAYNLTRAINIVGSRLLIGAIRA